jgi:hypothetical protein
MAPLASDLDSRAEGIWDLTGSVNLIQGVTISAYHSRSKVNIRGQPMVLRSVDGWRLSPFDEWRVKSPVKILFVQPYEVCSDMVGVVTLQARGHSNRPDEPMVTRLAVLAVGVGHMACRTAVSPVFSPAVRATCVEVATKTGTPQQIVSKVPGKGRGGHLFERLHPGRGVRTLRGFLSAESEPGLIDHSWG